MTNLDYLYNPDVARPYFDKNYFVDKKLGFQVIEHGTILPHKDIITGSWNWGGGGIIDKNGNFIKGSFIKSELNGIYTPKKESIHHSNSTIIYLGMFHSVWGHFITDCLRRLWFLKSEFFKSQFKNCPIMYLMYNYGWKGKIEQQPNFKRLLEILGVDIDKIQLIEEPTQFDKIILPDESFYFDKGKKFTAEYRETINCIRNFALKNRTPTSSEKIYYFHGMRNQIGEEHLAEYFKSKGYAIVRPEKLTLDEQLNMLINCKSFATTSGSISHNSIFLRDATEVILIPRAINRFAPPLDYQILIDQVFPMNVTYIDSTMSLFYANNHNYCYIISQQLKSFFGDKWDGYDEDDFKTFLLYVKNSLSKGLSINTNELKGYEKVLSDFMAQLKQRENLIASYDMPPHWKEFRSMLTYQTHIAKKGWGSWNSEEQISNDISQQLDIQAIKINFPNHKLYYSVYYNAEEGWSEEVLSPAQAGTTGKSKPIMGIRIRLDEAGAKEFDILYRVHKFDGTWTDWAKNGEVIYSHGVKLNAIQIKLESKSKP